MKKPQSKPKAKEILETLNGLWVDKKGIMIIKYCGDTKAGEEMKKIANLVTETTGKELPKGLVPTEEVIKYYNINIQYLKKIASMNLESGKKSEKNN